MIKDFKALQRTESGTIAPVLLVGAVANSKEAYFVELLAQTNPAFKTPFNARLMDAEPADLGDCSITAEVISKIEAQAQENGSIAAIFSLTDRYDPVVLGDLVERVNANTNPNILYVFGCEEPTNFPVAILAKMSKFQMVKHELATPMPVMQVEEIDRSPLHRYRDIAIDLAAHDPNLEGPSVQAKLDALSNLIKVMESIEGGIMGQEARDRGMDVSVMKAFGRFSRTFSASGNALAAAFSKSFIAQTLRWHSKPRFFEYQPALKRQEAEGPSLG